MKAQKFGGYMRVGPQDVKYMIGYGRVSTEEQAESGLGMEAQRRAVAGYIQSKEPQGWQLSDWVHDDAISTRLPISKRPGLSFALSKVRAGEVHGIVVAKMDRLSRSSAELGRLFEEARDRPFTLVMLDFGVDTSTAAGMLVARVLAAVAEWERDVISERTKAALSVKRSQGVVLGAPRQIPSEIESLILALRDEPTDNGGRRSYREIARYLTREGIPTVAGGTWSHSTVAEVVKRA